MLIFVVNIRPARTFWNSTHCLLSPFTLDWYRNLWHNPMWNMAVNNISYPIYPLSTRTEKGYITKMIPFFFCSVYHLIFILNTNTWVNLPSRFLILIKIVTFSHRSLQSTHIRVIYTRTYNYCEISFLFISLWKVFEEPPI